ETSGYAPATVFREIVALTDLVLFDLKLMDEAKHKQYTGVSNGKILENLNYLCVSGKAFIIRIPLIPEVNDNEANMLAVLKAIRGATSLLRVELMPYNKFAGAKYPMLGQTFAPPFDVAKAPNVINVFEKHDIKTVVL
ncbi:MAG: pyruvate formate lyase-activating protein, partial [Prevotellaceae bacterium]|nr:pyruvate formate lyase-activating protein [Prevotellaceae bacterium]